MRIPGPLNGSGGAVVLFLQDEGGEFRRADLDLREFLLLRFRLMKFARLSVVERTRLSSYFRFKTGLLQL